MQPVRLEDIDVKLLERRTFAAHEIERAFSVTMTEEQYRAMLEAADRRLNLSLLLPSSRGSE